MAKLKAVREAKPAPPSELTMELFRPGMTAVHRAGLGGLACTLQFIHNAYAQGRLVEDDLPGWLWEGGQPPWKISATSVTLHFGEAARAAGLLERLFKLAFGLKDGIIYLPGQYLTEPSAAVRADLQAGLTLSFLQHGKVRSLAKEASTVEYDPDGTGVPAVRVEYRQCSYFKHQDGWQEMVDKKGCLRRDPIGAGGPLNPGSVVRHVAYNADTETKDTADRLIPLYFALVGCLALPVNRGVAALIVPEVTDLLEFINQRPFMTPTSARECQIANAADGALQMQVRLKNKQMIATQSLPGCYAMTFRPTPWASQQKTRVATMHVPPGEELRLRRFEIALAELPPRVVSQVSQKSTGRKKKRVTAERNESFRVDSIVRPLVAENLALGRPWYAGFVRLMTALDSNNRPLRDKLSFERKGLRAMTENSVFWDHEGEATLVRAVHEALRSRYGQIADENRGNPAALKNRFAGEYDRWRLAFAGAKTADQFRGALCDLFSRARGGKVLRERWSTLLPFLDDKHWQRARDLALLGLASYSGRTEADQGDAGSSTSAAE
jgi:CRISPR-associated protein Cas8a1/Csx13